jgi:hypothetical protein
VRVGAGEELVGAPVVGGAVGDNVTQLDSFWTSSSAVVHAQVASPRRRVGADSGWIARFTTLLYSQTLISSPNKSTPPLFAKLNMT